ncbi:hypothetical protein [Micromonospora fluostatini]|uniref:hypothetical protein n=1 Tax=Micromonospora sp. JCM 30529 TaxID=3421643 RepID=UPI003D183288
MSAPTAPPVGAHPGQLLITAGHPLRTTPVPEEILDVVGVVLGTDRKRLSGWQAEAAVAAMTALGDSVTHICWSLQRRSVTRIARRAGVKTHAQDQRLDRWGLILVLLGVPLALRGQDRIVAIRLFAKAGLSAGEIATRLRMRDANNVRALADNNGIELTHAVQMPTPSEVGRRSRRHDEVTRAAFGAAMDPAYTTKLQEVLAA